MMNHLHRKKQETNALEYANLKEKQDELNVLMAENSRMIND